ncbi:hypothetical protein [Reinekea thalattae]|nr:hypothetical protein [Reinekea thalattae]
MKLQQNIQPTQEDTLTSKSADKYNTSTKKGAEAPFEVVKLSITR